MDPRPEMVRPCLKCAASAMSWTWILVSGLPTRRTKPVPSVSRSSASTSSSSAATCSITSRASRAAMMTALPTRCVPRLAKVTVRFGEPIRVAGEYDGVPTGRARRDLTDRIMAAIGGLTDQEPAGVYNERSVDA